MKAFMMAGLFFLLWAGFSRQSRFPFLQYCLGSLERACMVGDVVLEFPVVEEIYPNGPVLATLGHAVGAGHRLCGHINEPT